MTQGKSEQAIIRQCLREKRPLPKAIADAPDIDLGHELYYFAFEDLGSCRNYEAGEIPWTAIRQYCEEYGLDEEQRSIMFAVIREVDLWFLDRMEQKANRKSKRGKAALGNKGQKGGSKGISSAVGRR